MESVPQDFAVVKSGKSMAFSMILSNAAIVVGFLIIVMTACSIFAFNNSFDIVLIGVLASVVGALLFGFGLLGRILIEKK